MLSEREKKILNLLSEHEYISSARLGDMLGVSSRTVRSSMKSLQSAAAIYGAAIEASTRKGYKLIIKDRGAFAAASGIDASSTAEQGFFSGSSIEDRVACLLVFLLLYSDYVKFELLTERFHVSESTLSSDLKRADRIISGFSLQIKRKANYGLKIEGAELNIRQCLLYCLSIAPEAVYSTDAEFEHIKVKVSALLQEITQIYRLHFPEINYRNIINFVSISVYRIKKRRVTSFKQDGDFNLNLDGHKVHENTEKAVRALIKRLEADFEIDIDQTESKFLAVNMSGLQNYNNICSEEENSVIPGRILKLVALMLDSVEKSFKLDFHGNLIFRISLAQHIMAMDIRLRYSIWIDCLILQSIQMQYPLAYSIAEQALIPFRQIYNKEIPEAEIGYLACIFQLLLEMNDVFSNRKNILVVCAASAATSKLLACKLQKEFGAYIDELRTCSHSRLAEYDLNNFDYIFTTVPIRQKVNVPILLIDELLDNSNLLKVESVLNSEDESYLAQFYREDLFFTNIDSTNKEKAIADLCSLISEVETLPAGFYESVLEREKLARTDLCKLVAFPHSYKIATAKTFVAVGILKEPVFWIRNEVQLLLLISVAADCTEDMQRFYALTTAFMQDEKKVKKLLQKQNFTTLMNLLTK